MRILIVSEDIPYANMGGLAKHALNLARALVAAGHQVDILGGDQNPITVAGKEGQFGGNFFGELNGHLSGWKERRLGTYLPVKRRWVARRFADIILRRAANYDVIHYHGHVPNVARYIPASVNFVQTRHDHGSECMNSTRFRRGEICASVDPSECARCVRQDANLLQRTLTGITVRQYRSDVADAFSRHKTIFVSDMLRRNFTRTMGAGPWGAVVHNFIDVDRLDAARRSPAPRADDGMHVFIAGKFYAAKGMEAFLRELAPRLPDTMRVTFAGDGVDEPRLRAEFAGERIRFLGWCSPEQTAAHAAAADAIVVPSIWEDPCPSTIFEGLLLGKPTFALARGGAPELTIYAATPAQLRLHPDMRALVDDLVSFDRNTVFPLPSNALGSAAHTAEQLVRIYRLPPGRLSD